MTEILYGKWYDYKHLYEWHLTSENKSLIKC
jgi:hypothetical protein